MTISILGCGWLGLPLAKELAIDNRLKGSTTSSGKVTMLRSFGIEPYLLSVEKDRLIGDMDTFFDTDILFINIPPRVKRQNSISQYPKQIQQVISKLNNRRVQKILFASSTGVYKNVNAVVDESSDDESERGSGKTLKEAEKLIKSCGIDWVIIRMAGLIGPKRDPGHWFAGKSNIPNGQAPVNLVHLDDFIEISKRIIKSDIKNQTFNVCADLHPSRKEFYTAQSKRLGFELPTFKDELIEYKVVSNDKLKTALSYEYIHSDFSSCKY